MKKLHKSQKGFSPVEILLLILLLLLLIFLGWYVWNKKSNKPPANSNATPAKTEQKAEPKPAETPQPAVSYLKIPEWGVKFKLSDDIKDAYYDNKVTSDLPAFSLRVKALDTEPDCKNSPQSIATIFKVGVDDINPQNDQKYSASPKGKVIADKYYFIQQAQYNCAFKQGSESEPVPLLPKVMKAFEDASANIEKL